MTTNKTDKDYRDSALMHLVDEFAKLEGRRPRIMVALTKNTPNKQFNEVSSSLADLGFDVDIAPRFISFESLSRQAVENDVHTLLLLDQDTSINILINNIVNDFKKYQRSDIILLIKTNSVTDDGGEDVRNDGSVFVFGTEIETTSLAKFILKTLVENQ